MQSPPRRLRGTDLLYRAVAPEQYDPGDSSPYATAFEDTGGRASRPSETLSFSLGILKGPSDALAAICRRAIVRKLCGSGELPATPEAMFRAGYRVAALPAEVILEACSQRGARIHIVPDAAGNDYESNGHLQLFDGHRLADTWARHARLLDEHETFRR